jgi:hypothetical protein
MATGVLSVNDGPRTTVNDLVGNPMLIPARIIESLAGSDIMPALLRDAGRNTNGLVSFETSTPLYLDGDVEDVAEFAEIPVASGQIGSRRIAYGIKRALGVRVSREMRDENRMDQVNRQITQLTNTMARARMRVLRALVTDPAIPTLPASVAWDQASGRPRRDLAAAQEIIAAQTPFTTGADDDDTFQFDANGVVMPASIKPVLMDNDDFLKVYKDGLATQNIAYTGLLEREVLVMAALVARAWPQDRVLVLERKTVGFYSDTRPLESTGLYPEGNGPNGGATETWRSDTSEKRVSGLDQPLAACWITGVRTP